MGVFVIQWMQEYSLNFVSFYMFLFLIILHYFKHVYSKKSLEPGNDYAAPASFVINILPVCAAVFIISFAIPKIEKPIEWKWLDEHINKMYNNLNEYFKYNSNDYFSFHSTGFGQDEDRLGGKLEVDNTPVLEVVTSKRIYLKGACKNFYTGYSWINSNKSLAALENQGELSFNTDSIVNPEGYEQNEHFFEDLEPQIGLCILSVNNDSKDRFFEIFETSVTYLNLSTKTLFTPIKLQNIVFQPGSSRKIHIDSEGIFSSGKKLRNGYNYSLSSYETDYSDIRLKNMLISFCPI